MAKPSDLEAGFVGVGRLHLVRVRGTTLVADLPPVGSKAMFISDVGRPLLPPVLARKPR